MDWQLSAKEGDVQSTYDKAIAKNVLKIGGTPQSNYIQVPAQKNVTKQSLGLIGKYVYLIVQVQAGKQFVAHFDYVVNDSRTVRISASNLYKEFKNVDGKSLQLPLGQNFPQNKWVVVCINVLSLFEENKVFMAGQPSKFFMRSFQICAQLQLRGVFTSDIQYTVNTLPKPMQLKLTNAQADWFSEHAWLSIPSVEIDHGKKQPEKENKGKKSNLKATETKDKKSVQFTGTEEEKEKTADQLFQEEVEQRKQEAQLIKQDQTQELVKVQKENVERTLQEIEELKRAYNLNLESKHIQTNAQVTLYQAGDFYDPSKSQRRNCEKFSLQPDPILTLDRILGIHPKNTAGTAYFNKDVKLASEILYTQANCIVGYHSTIQKQRLLLDLRVKGISTIIVTKNYVVTVSEQLTGKFDRSGIEKVEIVLSVFDLESELLVIQIKPPLVTIKTLSASSDQTALAVSGKDQQSRDLIIVYSLQDLVKEQKVELLARQICDFDLESLKFVDSFNQTLIGCGKANNATLVQKELKTVEDIQNYKARTKEPEAPQPDRPKSPSKVKSSAKKNKVETKEAKRESSKEVIKKAQTTQSEMNRILVDNCGMIRFFKIKNNFLPSQLVSLDNRAHGKVFINTETVLSPDLKSRIQMVYATTECGLLYMVNFYSRLVTKIIQLHNDPIQTLINGDKFMLSASKQGNIRVWTPDFGRLVSEVSINQQISNCDINSTKSEICVMATDGTLSIFELETNSFKVIMRSHQDEVVQTCHSSGCLVSIGNDSSIKIWNAESLAPIQQIHEFNTAQTDPPTFVFASDYDDTIAVGFKSGFLRLFNLVGEKKMLHEIMVFDSRICSIAASKCGKFLATVHLSGKLVIFNTEKGDCKPVNNKDIESSHQIYSSVDFSPDGSYLANIGQFGSCVTIWETRNFSLRWLIDCPGEILTKICFAPNSHDLLIMTNTSKLKFLRYNPAESEVQLIREQFGMTDQECTDFIVTSNNKYIIATGKCGQIKIYDYFMRGEVVAASQKFLGHLKYANHVSMQKDMRYLYSVGPGNGIYRWAFFGDRNMPEDISQLYEKTQSELNKEIEKENSEEVAIPTFDQQDLLKYSEQQLGQLRQDIIGKQQENPYAPILPMKVPREHTELLQDGGISLKRVPKLECTPAGYSFEKHEIELQKLLGCSLSPKVGNNICWDRKNRCIIYSMQNVVIFELLNQEKSQLIKQETNDIIHGLLLSKNQSKVLAYTKSGPMDGYPQIIVWDTKTKRKVSQITIDDLEIRDVQFSNLDNMLLVVSYDGQSNSTIAVWDFLDGHQDYFCKARVPYEILQARWNPYKNLNSDEFMTICKNQYHYWMITKDLQMKYQLGRQPPTVEGQITTVSFVEPMYEQTSVYAIIGLSSGYVWVLDTKTNSFLHSVKVLDCAISKLTSTVSRIVVEGKNDPKIHSWELKKTIADFNYDARDPEYFFAGKEQELILDGAPSASFYDDTAVEAIMISQNNSIWLVNILEQVTVKIKSCHAPTSGLQSVDFKYVSPNQYSPQQTQDQHYTFDQNYIVGSSGQDGIVKLWQMYDMDHVVNFIVPKEECVVIAMHQFKPYMICSFTDGYLRFFDIQNGSNMGRCLINGAQEQQQTDCVTEIKILPSGNHVMAATKYGQVFLIFVETWQPLAVTIQNLSSLNQSLSSFDVSFLEPYNKWLASSNCGKIVVYNRQDCNSFKQELFDQRSPPSFIFMDSFNAQEYVDNSFTEAKRVNTLDHFYHVASRNLAFNEAMSDHETQACFLNNDLASYICYIRKCPALFIRNFELHQIVKKIDLQSRCLSIKMAPGSSPYVYLLLESNKIQMIDFVNETNSIEVVTLHEQVQSLKVCPNGRYLLTSGPTGDVAIWSVRRVKA